MSGPQLSKKNTLLNLCIGMVVLFLDLCGHCMWIHLEYSTAEKTGDKEVATWLVLTPFLISLIEEGVSSKFRG
jgi:hypothetical protein